MVPKADDPDDVVPMVRHVDVVEAMALQVRRRASTTNQAPVPMVRRREPPRTIGPTPIKPQ